MHSHIDRDRFVEIKWANIKPDTRDNFDKVNPRLFGNFGTEYDLNSVMHYSAKAFSKNGRETITPKDPKFRGVIGQRKELSVGDAARINNMYQCDKKL